MYTTWIRLNIGYIRPKTLTESVVSQIDRFDFEQAFRQDLGDIPAANPSQPS